MKELFIAILILLTAVASSAQTAKKKPVVFKVRAPAAACSVYPEDSVCWIEKENKIRVKIRSKSPDVKVVFSNGRVVSKEDEFYTLVFDKPGKTVVTVFEVNGNKRKMIHTSSLRVMEPIFYFCGVKINTIGRALNFREEHLRAHSIPLNTLIKITAFDMTYNDGIKNKTMHADSNRLSDKMYKIIFEEFKFYTWKSSLFFSNISATMPDGSSKFLSPFTIYCERDSTNTKEVEFKFSVRKMVLGAENR